MGTVPFGDLCFARCQQHVRVTAPDRVSVNGYIPIRALKEARVMRMRVAVVLAGSIVAGGVGMLRADRGEVITGEEVLNRLRERD